jgi:hypothetical protein
MYQEIATTQAKVYMDACNKLMKLHIDEARRLDDFRQDDAIARPSTGGLLCLASLCFVILFIALDILALFFLY